VMTLHIAEFWNTLSSLCILFAGILGLLLHSSATRIRFKLNFGLWVVVGLGSVAFHATLLRSMQMLDEVPMMW